MAVTRNILIQVTLEASCQFAAACAISYTKWEVVLTLMEGHIHKRG